MDLKDFVRTALVDIVSAVKEAHADVKEYATIAPLATYGDVTRRELLNNESR